MFRKTRHKYGAAQRVDDEGKVRQLTEDGYSFGSALELNTYRLLKAMEQKGEITIEQVQATVRLTPAQLRWVIDFRVFDHKLKRQVWVEAKGKEMERWVILTQLWPHFGPGLLRIYKNGGWGTQPRLFKEIEGIYQEVPCSG